MRDFPGGPVLYASKAGGSVSILGLARYPEGGNATYSRILAREIPWTGESGLQSKVIGSWI